MSAFDDAAIKLLRKFLSDHTEKSILDLGVSPTDAKDLNSIGWDAIQSIARHESICYLCLKCGGVTYKKEGYCESCIELSEKALKDLV